MTDVQKLTDAELAEAVDHVPLIAIDESHPVIKEWIDRRRAQRVNLQMATSEAEDRGAVIGLREARLKRVNQVTRAEALRISRQVLKDAERGRIEVAEREARQGIQYEESITLADRCAITELLKARQERRLKHGGELEHTRDIWSFALRLLYGAIEKASEEQWHFPDEVLYPMVADLGAACLAYMQAMGANASEKQDELTQSGDE